MASKNLIRSALTVRGRSGRANRAASRRGIRLAPLLLVAVMLAAVLLLAETSNPAQTAHAHPGDDHTHRDCSGVCPTYDGRLGGDHRLAATLTAGAHVGTAGYILLGGLNLGSLSPVTFMLDGGHVHR